MARQKSKAKTRSRSLSVRKQAVKDLPAGGKGPKGGRTTASSSSPTLRDLDISSKFQKV